VLRWNFTGTTKRSIETNDDEALPKRFKMHVAKGELPRWFDFMISEWQDDRPDNLHPG